ncbi:hypothetical protein FN846DRAFT_257345 [Sphaerosporella brunnea]|uniref:Uncharacterized protein n=1 Tax=Sphaerosporella brunnea TaxID=1250544 RepID=A0A5J5F7A3_9PEZI|nr:hypothetical protein FN846DRAFT_257345 [Sphaerosporella brunnea]
MGTCPAGLIKWLGVSLSVFDGRSAAERLDPGQATGRAPQSRWTSHSNDEVLDLLSYISTLAAIAITMHCIPRQWADHRSRRWPRTKLCSRRAIECSTDQKGTITQPERCPGTVGMFVEITHCPSRVAIGEWTDPTACCDALHATWTARYMGVINCRICGTSRCCS